jgi:hypothetical protein
MGDCAGGYSGELIGEKLCKIIENGELVNYDLANGRLVKKVYRNDKWIEE